MAQGPAKGPTVWDGVYTEAQAARATSVFGASCSNCHSLAPDGTGNRPLVGERFWQRNTQKSVGELLAFVSKNMPNGAAAGSLPAATYNDLVALILKSNGLPAGTAELTPDAVASVQIVPKDGPGELPANTLVRVVGCLAKSGPDWVLTSATAPVRADKTEADGRGCHAPARDPDRGPEVRPDPARFVRRPAHGRQRHADGCGGRGRDQRRDREPGRRHLPVGRPAARE